MTSAVESFREQGYFLFEGYFQKGQIEELRETVREAHGFWVAGNRQAMDKGAVNSAYLTSPGYCRSESGRNALFRFIASAPIAGLARELMAALPYFMNTQVFFNPIREDRKPYWHRDIQYTGLPESEQEERIFKDQVLHLRIPLEEDPGLEFIPGSHARRDTGEERKVRLELDGRRNSEALPGSVQVPHGPGDLLVFSAHLIHRGAYAGNRFSFDVLFASFRQSKETVESFGHFPGRDAMAGFENGRVFEWR